MKSLGKLLGLVFFIFVCFMVGDILYKITGSLFITLIIGFITLLFFMRYRARNYNT